MREWVAFVVIGLGTYALRAVFLATRLEPPARLARGLPYVGPAVLAAIVVPAIIAPAGTASPSATPLALAAAAITCALWHWTRSFPAALGAGMVSWWALTAAATLTGFA